MNKFSQYIILLVAIVLSKPILSQEITFLDTFEPYELIGDTIYFNRNNYDYVVTRSIDSTKSNRHETSFYILKDLKDLRYRSSFPLYTYKYQIPKSIYTNEKTYGFASIKSWRTKYPLKNKFVKITKTKADYYLKESSILLPGEKKDTTRIHTILSRDFFPALKAPIDSLLPILHFGNMEYYTLYINHNDSTSATISFSDVCNPTNHTQKKVYTRNELNKIAKGYIDQIHFPELKLENEIISYQVQINLSYTDYVDLVIKRERANGFKNSFRLFPENDSLFGVIDSFSNRTFYFQSQMYYGPFMELGYYIDWGLKDFRNQMADVNADGKLDLVLDTNFYEVSEVSTVGDIYTINYIPNKRTDERQNPSLVQTIQYSKNLGNNYYYVAKNTRSAQIFCIKDDRKFLILDITNDYINPKGRYSNPFYTHLSAYKKPELTQTLKFYSKQGITARKFMTRQIQYYLENPEKLPVDFPVN